MRAGPVFFILTSMVICFSPVQAQAPGVEVQAGLGYARVFDGGGISFEAALERPLTSPASRLQHGLGGSLWYARTTIASTPESSSRRKITGLGLRYQIGVGSRSIRPFLAVPVQLLLSSIPDRATLQGGGLSASGIPDPGPLSPVEDRVGSHWGWGAGVELGVRAGVGRQLSAQTSLQALYQDIYASGTRHGAWNWHAGLSYQLGTR
jgi:hypothetical protein